VSVSPDAILPFAAHIDTQRFSKNNFFIEKNPTIVNFPVKNWEVRDSVPVPLAEPGGQLPPSKYNLIANVCHDGKAGEGVYRCHIHRAAEDLWYGTLSTRNSHAHTHAHGHTRTLTDTHTDTHKNTHTRTETPIHIHT
jgi:U4/U6.U5 tri-snRNP-associated protein 2